MDLRCFTPLYLHPHFYLSVYSVRTIKLLPGLKNTHTFITYSTLSLPRKYPPSLIRFLYLYLTIRIPPAPSSLSLLSFVTFKNHNIKLSCFVVTNRVQSLFKPSHHRSCSPERRVQKCNLIHVSR